MKQTLLTPGRLLDENGRLAQAGYATSPVRTYDRSAIRASRLRIKEWDYYLITDGHIGLALTIADNGYMGLDSLDIVAVVTELMEAFDVELGVDDLTPENFNSVEAIEELIESRQS